VGRITLYLLDTNIPDNVLPQDRDITDSLYGGDIDTRIRQEIVLGNRRHAGVEGHGSETHGVPHE
jgi:glucan phosphorylase